MRGCECLSPWRTLPFLTVVSRVGVEVGLQAEVVPLMAVGAVGPVVAGVEVGAEVADAVSVPSSGDVTTS